MPGDAELAIDAFDLLIDEAEQRRLFSTPNMPVGTQDHCIGLHASSLVRDGGTLQIGIGAMGDAVPPPCWHARATTPVTGPCSRRWMSARGRR
jgi:acyl-CoA hydrolase